jgi:predicted dehydrogenase
MNRRSFLYSTAAIGTGLALSAPGARAANNGSPGDINVALLGAGAQGEVLLNACIKMGAESGFHFRAVCDIWEDLNLRRVVSLLGRYGHEVKGYTDYRTMLDEQKQLNAVIIATPDFCHAEQAEACLKAGLHV